jgi:hypothetical protein
MTTKFTKTIVATLFVACGLILTSCGGAPGATGPQGPIGATGLNGLNGNANVMSYKFSVDLSNFNTLMPNGAYQCVLNPAVIMGNGTTVSANDVVLMYLYDQTVAGTDYYNALPYNDYWDSSTEFNQFSFEVGATGPSNYIWINIRNSGAGQPYTPMSGPLNFKMVYIQASNLRVKPTLPKDLSYASVKAYYHLKD